MRFETKDYQARVLDSLKGFLSEAGKTHDPRSAFEAIVKAQGRALQYIPVAIPEQELMPYVCLRVPTGGGKTVLACHAVGLVNREYLHADCSLVLWLVPSNTIREQTAKALRDAQHPYRRALELGAGPAEILTIEEALRMTPAAVAGQTVVIVSTIQCFRVEDTEGRKVYDPGNSYMHQHLQHVPPDRAAELEKGPDGQPANSLVNVLRLHRPVVIVDEAHNVNTPLSFATLAKVSPSCVIEFTATPNTVHNIAKGQYASNVLHRVSAAELKAAAMIKMPIRVFTEPPARAQHLLSAALSLRADLEGISRLEGQETGEYIRPILLVQARSIAETMPMREQIAREYSIPLDQIAISTGAHDDLQRIDDVSSPSCTLRVIITVQKLREGWDCPFAYVLCSLRDTRSATAIEQIVGRIMRLPQVAFKNHAELNQAYAFSVSPSIREVLGEVKAALESNGFTKLEADQLVISGGESLLQDLWNQPKTVFVTPSQDIDQTAIEKHGPSLAGKVVFDLAMGTITVAAPLSPEELLSATACLTTVAKREALAAAAAAVAAHRATLQAAAATPKSPHERQETFFVPLLCVHLGQETFQFDQTVLMEHPWRLSQQDATLDEKIYPATATKLEMGFLDVGTQGQVTMGQTQDPPAGVLTDFIGRLHQQLIALGMPNTRTVEDLVTWLDRNIEHRDIPADEAGSFLGKVVRGLITSRGIPDADVLWRDRFRLRDAVSSLIDLHRRKARCAAFQALLLDESELATLSNFGIDFRKEIYEPGELYSGDFQFKKHYYGPRPGDLKSSGEECECAVYLDGVPQVKYWIRNISKRRSSFSLQTSTDRFYPDFICLLTDGRRLAVEYKGKDRYDGLDAQEKRAIGAVWESRSGGLCLFVMPEGRDLDAIRRKIEGRP